MTSAPLSFATTFDGSTPSVTLLWPGADATHVVLFDTSPANGFAPISPSLASHSAAGAALNVPPGWQGDVVVTLLQGYGPQWAAPIITSGRATFVSSRSAPLVWSRLLPDVGYLILPGPAVITDGSGPVIVMIDASTKSASGLTVRSSGAFSGYVDVLAFQPGANPMLGAA